MRIITTILLSFIVLTSTAQTEDYNKWSIGGNVGFHRALRPSGANISPFGLHHYGGNLRYMINNRVGVMGDVGYDYLDVYNTEKYSTDAHYFRISLQGVVNAGDILRFSTFTKHVGLLVHGGAGISMLWRKTPEGQPNLGTDHMGNFIFGITPQVKLGERWSLNADMSFIFHARQSRSFDFVNKNNRKGINGYLLNLSVGASFYIGKHKVHADWVPTVYGGKSDTEDLAKRVAELEEALKDDDNDGVPNGRDIESDTPADSYVNSKGEEIIERDPVNLDRDNDGFLDTVDECPEIAGKVNGCPDRDGDGVPDAQDECPDEFGTIELHGCALSKEDLDEIKTACESIYFNTGKAIIKTESFSGLNKLAKILNENKEVNAMIEGHTDNTGEDEFNLNLSKERAAEVRNYLIEKGVSADRLKSEGFGSTKPIATNDTEEGRSQNRRVKVLTTTYTESK